MYISEQIYVTHVILTICLYQTDTKLNNKLSIFEYTLKNISLVTTHGKSEKESGPNSRAKDQSRSDI